MSNTLQIMVGVFAFCFIWSDYGDYWPQIIKRMIIE